MVVLSLFPGMAIMLKLVRLAIDFDLAASSSSSDEDSGGSNEGASASKAWGEIAPLMQLTMGLVVASSLT